MLTAAALALVRVYRSFSRRSLSPSLPPRCRFTPSCSAYAEEALLRRGFWRGAALAAWRLLRCHPLGGHGYDPVWR